MAAPRVQISEQPPETAIFTTGEPGFIPPGRCIECQIPIPSLTRPFAVLRPCSHIICSSCLATALAIKPPTDDITCIDCDAPVKSHIPYKQVVTTTKENQEKLKFIQGSEIEHAKPIARDIYTNPSEDKDPFRFWLQHRHHGQVEKLVDKGIIYFVDVGRNKDEQVVLRNPITCHFDSKEGYCLSAVDEEKLEQIFVRLNSVIVKPAAARQQQLEYRNLMELVQYAIDDNDIVTRLAFCLGGGIRLTSEARQYIKRRTRENSCYERSDWLAAWAVKNLLLQFQSNQTGKSRVVSLLQQMIGDTLFSFGVEKKAITQLSEFRLSASLSYLENKSKIAIQNLLLRNYAVPLLAFIGTCYDNFELEKKGKDHEMQHWVFQSVMQMREERLREIGFYAEHEKDRISRVGKSLEEVREECETLGDDWIEAVFGERPVDHADFSFYLLRYIQTAIELALLSIQGCEEMESSRMFSTCTTKIPRNLGVDVHPRVFDPKERYHRFEPRHHDPNDVPSDYYRYKAEDFDPGEAGYQTMLSMNSVVMDPPLKADLNREETVVRYMDQHIEINKDQLDQVERELPEGHERPVAEIMFAHVSDGKPTGQILRILDQYALRGDPKYSKYRAFVGGFHTMKDAIEGKHKLTEEVIRRCIEGHRRSERAQNKIVYPSDPNEFEEHEIKRIVGMLRDAVEECAETKGSSSVSPAEVHQHMLDCAAAHPDSMEVLIDVYNAVIYFMIRDSERCNSCELFFTAVRLALPLFATTNCFNYIRICFELLLWRSTAPDAEIVLFRETSFTRETPRKKHLFVDRAQEKLNFIVRQEVGDVVMPGSDRKVEKAVLNLDEITQRKQNVKAVKGQEVHRSSGPFNESTVSVDHVYVYARLAMHKLRIWDRTRPEGDNVLRFAGGELTPTEFLLYRSIGNRRVWEYGDVFYAQSRHSVPRPTLYKTGGVPVSRLRSQPHQLKLNESTRQALMFSLSADDVRKACKKKKDPLVTEILAVRGLLQVPPSSVNFTKTSLKRRSVEELIGVLIDCRKKYIQEQQHGQQDMDMVFQHLEGVDMSTMDAYSDPALRATELNLTFYKLVPSVRNRFNNTIEVAQYNDE